MSDLIFSVYRFAPVTTRGTLIREEIFAHCSHYPDSALRFLVSMEKTQASLLDEAVITVGDKVLCTGWVRGL